jgi:hypothetical protein
MFKIGARVTQAYELKALHFMDFEPYFPSGIMKMD